MAPTRISVSTICSVAVERPSVGARPMTAGPLGCGLLRVRLTVSVPSTTPSLRSGTVTVFADSPAPNSTVVVTAV